MAERRGSRTHQGLASSPSAVLKTVRHTGADALPVAFYLKAAPA